MSANLRLNSNRTSASSEQPVLYLALELGWESWKLAFSRRAGSPPRRRAAPARDTAQLMHEIAEAKRRLRLPANCPVKSCYEAGRDGFWLHRALTALGVENVIVDSSSIEVNRRQRRTKTDRLDAEKLLSMLLRYHSGEQRVWSVVQVPSPADEDARQLHRELMTLKEEAIQHVNRIKSLLAGCGCQIEVDRHFEKKLKELRQWDGSPIADGLKQRLLREFERLQVTNRQARELEKQRVKQVREEETPAMLQVRKLLGLKAIGMNSAWVFVREFFGWRNFANRKQIGGLSGLAATAYASGETEREQGISKAGNKRLRWMAVEIAWCWVRFQPNSALTRWFYERYGRESRRQRKTGIVALARKLLVQLWRYLQTGVPPAGAELVSWETKTRGKIVRLEAAGR